MDTLSLLYDDLYEQHDIDLYAKSALCQHYFVLPSQGNPSRDHHQARLVFCGFSEHGLLAYGYLVLAQLYLSMQL